MWHTYTNTHTYGEFRLATQNIFSCCFSLDTEWKTSATHLSRDGTGVGSRDWGNSFVDVDVVVVVVDVAVDGDDAGIWARRGVRNRSRTNLLKIEILRSKSSTEDELSGRYGRSHASWIPSVVEMHRSLPVVMVGVQCGRDFPVVSNNGWDENYS